MTTPQPNMRSAASAWMNRALAAAALAVMFGLGLAIWMALRPAETVTLRVAAGPAGSDVHRLLEEVNDVARKTGRPVRLDLAESSDPSEAIRMLNEGAVDLAAVRADTPVVADIRLVASLFDDRFQMIVRRDAGIFGLPDIAGKRLALPPSGSDELKAFFILVDHYDLDVATMGWRATTLDEAAGKLLAGEVDALFTLRSLRDGVLLKLVQDAEMSRIALDILPVTQAGAISIKRPLLHSSDIPLGALGGATPVPSRDIRTLGVDRILVAGASIDSGAVRTLTELLFENRLDLVSREALAASISAPSMAGGLAMPLHDGARSFYDRDKPSFIQENAEPLALGVTLFAMIVSAFLALRRRLTAKQKNRADIYNHRLLALNERALAATDRQDLEEIRAELARILAAVVVALDTDEVTDEGFQSFARIHEGVSASVRDRLAELRTGASA